MVLLAAFAAVEARVSSPLVPLRLLLNRNLTAASVTGVLWTAAMFACFFLTTLYLQNVLRYSPLQTGLAFLPMNLTMSILSAGAAARLGATGDQAAAGGRAAAGRRRAGPAGPGSRRWALRNRRAAGRDPARRRCRDRPHPVAPGSHEQRAARPGLASGMANTSFMLGGALGLAVLAGIATTRTGNLVAAGQGQLAALTGGYHAAFLGGAACAVLAALLSAWWLRITPAPPANPDVIAPAEPALTSAPS